MAGFGATGAPTPPGADDAREPLLGWRGVRPTQGTGTFGLTVEAASNPLVRTVVDPEDGSVLREEAVIADLLGLQLAGRYALSDRVELGVTLPLWVTSGVGNGAAGFGDLAVHVPVGLAEYEGPVSAGLSVVPWVTLPTGAQQYYLGDVGPSVGTQIVGEVTTGPLITAGWFGFDVRAFQAESNVRPGPGAVGGASVGLAFDERFGMHLGWRGDGRLLAADVTDDAPRRATGSELALSARAGLFSGWWASAGIGGATQKGPGAADLRIWLSAGKTFGTAERGPTAVPVARVRVLDPAGDPVAAAVIRVGGEVVATTAADGTAELQRRRWRRSDALLVSADGLLEGRLGPPEDDAVRDLVLEWRPVDVAVNVQDVQGRPLTARLVLTGTESDPVRELDVSGGVADLQVDPGTWQVAVRSDGFGAQRRSLILEPRGPSTEDVSFILLGDAGEYALDVRMSDVEGNPVPDASLSLDGQPVGSSASGGDVWVGGLADQGVTLDAQAATFRDYTRPEVTPEEPAKVVELTLTRQRGAVQVLVRGPEGRPVGDASTRFLGTDRLGPYRMGETGRRTFVLRPGNWQLLVNSPQYGTQQRRLDVPDRDTALQVVEVVLQPPEEGRTDLALRVVDPDNKPVYGAQIALDDAAYGRTSTGGELTLQGLREGPRVVSVTGDHLVPLREEILLYGGLQERTLVVDWEAGTTVVMARSDDGMVGDATARFAGPGQLPPTPLGEDGLHILELDSGLWQVLVASPVYGAVQQGVSIPAGSRVRHVVDAYLSAGERGAGQLRVEVVDPSGSAVSGAQVSLDSTSLGETSTAGTLTLIDLATGSRTLDVARAPYAAASRAVQVGEGGGTERIELDWGIGAVRVVALADGLPVTDARVRMGGPRFVPATPVGADGSRLFSLEPGAWQVLVNSPDYGVQQRRLSVPPEPSLTEVVVDLDPAPVGVAQVLVRVQDLDGGPVPGAEIAVDQGASTPAGEGGLAVLEGVVPGTHRLDVTAPRFRPATFTDVEIVAGPNERILPLQWEPQRLTVRVLGPDGPVAGARVQLDGPGPVEPALTDPTGTAVLSLRPGTWTVLAGTEALGTRAADVELTDADAEVTLELRQAQVEVEGGTVVIKDRIYFDVGKSTLRPESIPILDEVAASLLAHPEIVQVEVGGHTDPIGGVAFNMELSRRRAARVVDELVFRGVAPERLTARGYGPTRPMADNETVEGRAANRRVEFQAEVQE